MSLLQQINETANKSQIEHLAVMEKFDEFNSLLDPSDQQLDEAATEWLAKLRGVLGKGALDPAKKQNAAYILGALLALTEPVNIDALNITDVGTLLYNVSSQQNPAESKAAVERLIKLGMGPTIKKDVQTAAAAMENPQEINKLIGQVQTKIDQVMRANLAKEKGGATSATGGGGVGGSPERAA